MALPERLVGRISGDVLCLFSPDVRGTVLGSDVFVRKLNEDTLDEGDNRRIAPVVRD
jgi:hypothetical protein